MGRHNDSFGASGLGATLWLCTFSPKAPHSTVYHRRSSPRESRSKMNSTYYIDPELFTVSPMADIGAVMQVSEASFLYMTISNTTYVWRNIMFQLCMISLNMLQLEIFQCFNGGLLRFRWFHSENIKYMRITSLIIHIICGWSSYLQGLAFPYEEGSIFAKWSPIGAAVYSVIICGIGLSQNMLILIRAHLTTTCTIML
ncbi:hypothetical protein BASA50_001500 [Batrachochytrium salamandrivorans]|uniref:Uncharacterized protein n=1 Tax=Batrachochytrium salamandrivorans TaxID=1357716 RepID=A0ABQ8FP46_9FUNG|nr:hypothetical protein BASA50_001500 [Batrachochytrium salamandrivorans]